MPDDIIDREELKGLYGDDAELIEDMFSLYRDKSGGAIDNVRRALKGGEAADIQMAAHRLKGVLSSICARHAVEAAQALEKHTAAGTAEGVAPLAEALEAALAQVDQALKVKR